MAFTKGPASVVLTDKDGYEINLGVGSGPFTGGPTSVVVTDKDGNAMTIGAGNGGLGAPNPGTSGGVPYYSSAVALSSSALLASGGVVLGGGAGTAPATNTGLTFSGSTLTVGLAGTSSGILALTGSTSGTATITAPAAAGTTTNPIALSNAIILPNIAGNAIQFQTQASSGFRGDGGQGVYWVGNGNLGINLNNTFLIQGSGNIYQWASTSDATGVADTGLSRLGAASIGAGNGTSGDFSGTFKSASVIVAGASGETWTQGRASELLTLNTGGLTTDTAANLLPANSIIEAVVCRITTTITVTTNWAVGDPTTGARFSAANATKTAGTTSVGIDHWSGAVTTLAAGPSQAAAAKIRITCTGSNPGAGVIRITVFYRTFVAPTA